MLELEFRASHFRGKQVLYHFSHTPGDWFYSKATREAWDNSGIKNNLKFDTSL
jgi:hypothetical protein